MSKLTVKITSGGKFVSQHTATRVLADKPLLVVLQAKAGQHFELLDSQTKKPPEKIFARRVGKDLHISLVDCNEPDVIIGDFFNPTIGSVALLGEKSGQYMFEDSAMKEFPADACDVSMVLTDTPAAAAVAVLAPLAFGPLGVGALALLGVGAAASGGSSGGGTNPDTTPPATASGALAGASDTGVKGDNKTNNNKPSISGATEPGAKVAIMINGLTYTTTADASGNYSVPVLTALPDGTYPVKITATDAAGNKADFTGTPIVVDTVTNVAITDPGKGTTNSPITGTAEAGSVVTLTGPDQKVIGSTTVDADGKWSITPAAAVPAGNVMAVAKDSAGNAAEGAKSNITSIGAPTVTIPTDGNQDGFINKAESGSTYTASISLPAGAKVGDVLTIKNGADTKNQTLTDADVKAGKVTASYNTPTPDAKVTVEAYLTSGQIKSSTSSASATFDTSDLASGAKVEILTDGNNDGTITTAEIGTAGTLKVKVTLPVSAKAGDTLAITPSEGSPKTVTLAAADISKGSYEVDMAIPKDGATASVSAVLSDAAGNKATLSDSAVMKTPVPGALKVTLLADGNNDGLINASEAPDSIYVAQITLPAGSVVGDTLSVTLNGVAQSPYALTQTDISAGFKNLSFTKPADGATVTVAAKLTNSSQVAGPEASDSAKFDLSKLTGMVVAITTDGDNDGSLTASELKGGPISVKFTLPADAAVGDKLVISNSTSNLKETVTLVAADITANSITRTFTAPGDGQKFSVSASISDAAGNASPAPDASDSATIKTAVAGAPVVEIVDDKNNNGWVAASESNASSYTAKITFTGAAAGDKVNVQINGIPSPAHILTAQEASAGAYIVSVPKPAAGAEVKVSATITNSSNVVSPAGSDAAKADGASTIAGATAGAVTEDASPNTTSGQLTITDVNSDDQSFVAPSVMTGTYGNFTLNPANGTWSYTLDNTKSAVQELKPADKVTDSILVTSKDGTASQSITVTITGANDAAAITGQTSASVTSSGDGAKAEGTLSVVDSDRNESSFVTPVNTDLVGKYGSFTFEASTGKWTYTADPAKTQALGPLDKVDEKLVVKSFDGTSKTITVTVQGMNDMAVITGVNSGETTEDDVAKADASGKITVTDPDPGQSGVQIPSNLEGTYGKFTVAADGTWSYKLDNTKAATQALAAGATVFDTIEVTSIDGGAKTTISVKVTGTNDAAKITGDTAATVTDNGTAVEASGTLAVTDADTNQSSFVAPAAASLTGTHGTFTFEPATGKWTYKADPAKTAPLGKDDSVVDTLVVKALDGTSQTISVTVKGKEDAAVISGDIKGDATEDATITTATGQLTVVDPDAGQSSVKAQAATAGTYGSFSVDATGKWTYALDNSKAATQALKKDEVKTDAFTVVSADGATNQTVTVSVKGVNDAATIVGNAAAEVTDEAGKKAASGKLDVTDVDTGEAGVISQTNFQGTYGSFNISASGAWDYALDSSKAATQALGAGQSANETITVTSADGGTTKDIVIKVTGVNNAATVTGTKEGVATEDNASLNTTGGTLVVADPDAGESEFKVPTNLAGTYGAFTITAQGVWTYTLDNSKAATNALAVGKNVTDKLTVLSKDESVSTEIVVTITGANDVATITGTKTGAATEDSAVDAMGTLAVNEVDTGEAVFTVQTPLVATYGIFTFETTTGAWSYKLDSTKASVQGLVKDAQVTDKLTVRSADGTATEEIIVTITGVNDGAVITGTTTGALTEDAATSVINSSLSITDADVGESSFQTPTPAELQGVYGLFSFNTGTGTWDYQLNNTVGSATHTLGAGVKKDDVLTVKSKDGGTSQAITVTVTGVNDPSSFAATSTATGTVTEDAATLTATGALVVNDVDAGENQVIAQTAVAGTYGSFSIDSAGAWTYTLDNASAAVQALNASDEKTETFTVTSKDGGATKDVVVTVKGANDNVAPVAVADAAEAKEASGVFNATAGVDPTGNVLTNDTDADAGDAFTVVSARTGALGSSASYNAVNSGTSSSTGSVIVGQYGSLTIGSDGSYKYTVNNGNSTVDGLNSTGPQQTLLETFSYKIKDSKGAESASNLVITINGENDFGKFRETFVSNGNSYIATNNTDSSSDTYQIGAGSGSPNVGLTGAIDFFDWDGLDSGHTMTHTSSGDLNFQFSNLFSPSTPTDSRSSPTVSLNKAGYTDLRSLAEGETATGTVVFTSNQGAQHSWTLTIVGVQDVATFAASSTATGSVTEDAATTTATGTLTVNDLDKDQNQVVAQTNVAGTYGSFSIDAAGAWTYTLDNTKPATQALNDGEQAFDTLTVESKDGTASKEIKITVNGANEPPLLMAAVPLNSIGQTAADGYMIFGSMTGQDAGSYVSDAGDVNGDGLADVIVSSTGVPAGNPYTKAHVVFGKANQTNVNLGSVDSGTGGFSIKSDSTANKVTFVSAAGDINADGLDDVFVMEENAAGNSTAFVIYGKTNTATVDLGQVATNMTATSEGWPLFDGNFVKKINAISNAGDVNGDGFDDVIVGNGDSNKSYVVFGRSTYSNSEYLGTSGAKGITINGQVGQNAGGSVSSAGDFNNDGYSDVIIGSTGAGFNKAYVVFGKPGSSASTVNIADIESGTGGLTITKNGGNTGWTPIVSNAGDVNGDGFSDVIIGDAVANNRAGKSYVVYGGTNTTAVDVDSLGTRGFVINGQVGGAVGGDNSGWSVSTAGDVNGDGYSDLIVGSPTDGAGSVDRSYVVFGRAGLTDVNLSTIETGLGGFIIQSGDGFFSGSSVSTAGDVNGDGIDDLYVGDNTANGAGNSYVIFGGEYLELKAGGNILASAIKGTTGNDTLAGTAAADVIIGNTGNDTITPGGGADKVFGGAGNDVVIATQADITNLVARTSNFDGGEGLDTFRMSGSGVNMNLTQISTSLDGFEAFDLGESGANTIVLNKSDVLALGEANITGSSMKKQMLIVGDTDDTVKLLDLADWTKEATNVSFGGNDYMSYTNQNMQLLIEQGITVTA
jgi:VCBS repeat-containing protein